MQDLLFIEIKNPKAKDLLNHLEELHWIKVIDQKTEDYSELPKKKFRGILSKKEGDDLKNHIETMRAEWGDI